MPALPQQANVQTEPSIIDGAALEADVKVISDLQGLEDDFSGMMIETRKDLKECDLGD